MDKKIYKVKLYGMYDKISGELFTLGTANNAGQYARDLIPNLSKIKPLNDLIIYELGEMEIGSGKIYPNEKIKEIKWQEAYKFEITNKSVKDETETSKETDKE